MREPKWETYVNPDGSRGGMVSKSAVIEKGAFIPVSSVVLPRVHVKKNMEITNGDLVTQEGAVRFTP